MSSERGLAPNRPRRRPRKGFVFILVRFAGWLLKVAGLLLLGIALIGFFVMLVRIGPAFVGSFRYLDQQIGRLILLLQLMWLLIFPVAGLVGAAIAGIGLALGYVGTEPAVSTSIIRPDLAQMSQIKEPPTQRAG
jgi:hypothetical protein